MLRYFQGRSFGYIIRFVFAAPLALIIWLAIEIINIFRPVYVVGLSYKGRITQYMAPMELHLRQANQTKKKYLMIFVMPVATPNEAVRTIYRRHALIIDSHFPKIIRDAYGMVQVLLKQRLTPELSLWQLLWSLEPATSLNKTEIEFGKNLLHQLGIPEGSQYVCLGVKEAAYYASITQNNGYGQDLTHQAIDSRNVDINNYMLAATHLANLGIYVVRVGSVVGAPLPAERHKFIIDYAYESRTELGDVLLGKGCKFFLCGVTGSWVFAAFHNKPIVYCDHYFEHDNNSSKWRNDQLPNSILITRLYKDVNHNFLTFKTIIDSNVKLLRDDDLTRLGITSHANTSSEISEAVLELNCRIDGRYSKPIDEEFLQNRYYNCFVPPFPWREFNMRVATSFLRKYQDLL